MVFKDDFDILQNAHKLFFVGIGGISMSSIAFVFRSKGYTVSGSDRAESDMTRKLARAGITVHKGHCAANVHGADAVIYTGAVNEQNPEIAEAKRLGLPLIYRADALGYMMKKYETRIGVSGSHGKSTCTAMTAHVLIAAGKDPTVMCGAETAEMGGAYRVGEKKDFVFEACEYKDSFLGFFPTVSVVLNIDLDHTDYFTEGLSQIKASFRKYAEIALHAGGIAIANADDENTVSALEGLPVTTFGINADADFAARNITYECGYAAFDIFARGSFFCRTRLAVPGEHNIYNALAAAASSAYAGVSAEEIARCLSDFAGLSRRFERKGSVGGAEVYIDYAHHPKELRAAVSAARKLCRGGKLLCVFEPHTYSRTYALFDEFAGSFSEADKVYFTDIYAAREVNTYGVSSEALAKAAPGGEYASSYAAAAEKLRAEANAGDIILILGAGTVTEVAAMLVQ